MHLSRFKLRIFLLCVILFLFADPVRAQENNEYELDNVEFRGNEVFPSSVLSDVIVSKQTPNYVSKTINNIYSKFGRAASIFDSLLIQGDLRALNYFYKDNGFFETKFGFSYKLDFDTRTAGLVYDIYEGPCFTVREHRITGIDSLPFEFFSKLNEFRLDSSEYFSKKLLDESRNLLISCLRDNGYMLARMDIPRVDIDTLSNCVDISVHVTPGIQYVVDTLRVVKIGQGKDDIDDELIKKIARIKLHDSYSAYEKQRAQVRLYRTNLFSSVMISANIQDTMDYHVPLTIAADIGTLHELSPELILGNRDNSFNLGFGANYSRKNFLGNARNFVLSGNFAVQDFLSWNVLSNLPKFFTLDDNLIKGYVDIRASLEQPYFFDEPITTRVEAFWTENKTNEYKSFTLGGKLNFDFELPKYVYVTSLNAYYSIEGSIYNFTKDHIRNTFHDKFSVELDSAQIANSTNFDSNWETTSIIGTNIGINKTNNPIFPTRGYNLYFTFEEANLLLEAFNSLGVGTSPKSLFYKVQTSISLFPAIYNSHSSAFGIKLKAGYLQTYAGQKNLVPLNKRFTAGGSNSVRGWKARDKELMPEGSQNLNNLLNAIKSKSDLSDIFKDIPLGGTFLLEGSFETRNRLFSDFGMAAFIDFGNTWEGYENFSFDKIAVAFGFGFRYYSDFAPFRIDFGIKAYDPNEKKTVFNLAERKHFLRDMITIHLGIGEAF